MEVSPPFPGWEIATAALSSVSVLSTVHSADVSDGFNLTIVNVNNTKKITHWLSLSVGQTSSTF